MNTDFGQEKTMSNETPSPDEYALREAYLDGETVGFWAALIVLLAIWNIFHILGVMI